MPTIPETPPLAPLAARMELLAAQGQALEAEGLPFPTSQIRESFERAVQAGQPEQAARVLRGGESLLAKVAQDWTWVRELLRRADELRAIAGTLGVDLQHLDARVGNPRTRLQTDPLSSGSLEKAAASASLSLAVLKDAVPKFIVQEAQNLGESIRRARDRGEDVTEAARLFGRLLQGVQDTNLTLSAQRLVETRRAVSRIPRAPALPAVSPHEEEEILLEARNLARRLQRIKGKARDAQSAARLMSQVRAALSEDRRTVPPGTPEEEIEELYLEVDRIARERRLAAEEPLPGVAPRAYPPPAVEPGKGAGAASPATVGPGAGAPPTAPAEGAERPEPEEPGMPPRPPVAFLPYNPYIPPEIPPPEDPTNDPDGLKARARNRPPRARPQA